MSNKAIGTTFERELVETLGKSGYWVHFIAPDARGAQPFDVIAVKDGKALAIDCKTCVAGRFSISRLEDNQVMAFEKWLSCGNTEPIIMVKHKDVVYQVPYLKLKKEKSVKLEEMEGLK